MSMFCLRTKTCLLLFTFITGLCTIVFLLTIQKSDPYGYGTASSWNRLVSKTQRHLADLNENPQRHKATDADPYLRKLGFADLLPVELTTQKKQHLPAGLLGEIRSTDRNADSSSTENGSNKHDNEQSADLDAGGTTNLSRVLTDEELAHTIPVILIPVLRNQGQSAIELLTSIRLSNLYNFNVILYDLGLGYYERQDLQAQCANFTASGTGSVTAAVHSVQSSSYYCRMKTFDSDKYPSHVHQLLKYDSYRPIIIQETLQSTGAVFYVTANQRFVGRIPESVLRKSRKNGILGWGLQDSTSSMTHPKTFAFFHTDPQSYYFHRTARGDRFIIFNTADIRQKLMLPWLQCSLTYRCIAPLGAQDTGCNVNRRPLYLYSGCHYYDWSVFNVILGLLFKFDSDSYVIDKSESSTFLMEKDL